MNDFNRSSVGTMKRGVLPLAILLILSTSVRAQSWSEDLQHLIAVDAPLVVIENVTVIDGTGSDSVSGRTVLIEDGYIRAIGSEIVLPLGAHIVDGKGKTLIPGLVGLHNHTYLGTNVSTVQLNRTAPRMYLGSGVTTIRTTGSLSPYSELDLRTRIERREAAGPRVIVTGPYLDGEGGAPEDARIRTAEDARRVVGYWVEEGITWFKAYANISRVSLEAVIDEAHRRGAKVTAHLCSVTFREAVALGIDNIEHGLYTNSDYVQDKEPDRCPGASLEASLLGLEMTDPAVQATFQDMIQAGVGMTSTLAVYEAKVPGKPALEPRLQAAVSAEIWRSYLEFREGNTKSDRPNAEIVMRRMMEYDRAFVQAGGLLAAGVDPGGSGVVLPGFGDQRNFELLHEAGFSTPEVVRIMTLNGAIILEMDQEIGTIESGKRAEMVLIDGDLLSDPALIRNVELVFRDGVAFDARALIDSVTGEVGVR